MESCGSDLWVLYTLLKVYTFPVLAPCDLPLRPINLFESDINYSPRLSKLFCLGTPFYTHKLIFPLLEQSELYLTYTYLILNLYLSYT